MAGIRIVGDGPDSSGAQLRDSMLLASREGNGGHVLWFSRGVLDVYSRESTALYAESGSARSPRFLAGGLRSAQPLQAMPVDAGAADRTWRMPQVEPGRYQLIGHDGQHWQLLQSRVVPGPADVTLPSALRQVELLRDRRTRP